jgi:hypothetical protein
MIRKNLTTLALATFLSTVSMVSFAASTAPTDTVDPMASPKPAGVTTHKKPTHSAKPANTTNTSHVPGAKGGNANGNDQSPSTGTGTGGGVNSGTQNEIQ